MQGALNGLIASLLLFPVPFCLTRSPGSVLVLQPPV